jgi:hypothetical protein
MAQLEQERLMFITPFATIYVDMQKLCYVLHLLALLLCFSWVVKLLIQDLKFHWISGKGRHVQSTKELTWLNL